MGCSFFFQNANSPQPVTDPWMTIPITLETVQYNGRPVGKLMVKKANMKGIIHSNMRLVDAC